MLKLCKSFAVLALGIFFFLPDYSAFAATSSVSGSLPRPLTENKFQIQVQISGISEAEQEKAVPGTDDGANSTIAKRFKFYLNDNSTPVPFTADTTSTVNFYARESLTPNEEQVSSSGTTTWTHTYYVEFVGINDSNALVSLAGASKTVNVKFDFSLGDTEILEAGNTAIKQDSFVINAQPTFVDGRMVVGTHKSLIVNFNQPSGDLPAIAGTTATTKPASRVLVYLVDSTVVTSAVTITGKKYSGSDAEDTGVQCTYTPPTGNGPEACVSCEDNVYLGTTDLPQGFSVRDVPASEESASFINLENERNYYAFMQYANGVQRTDCIIGIPKGNVTVTELNGAGEANVVDFRCFIATAAYGSPTHAKVKYFRKFRDEVLLRMPGGEKIVDLYYKYSPPMADFIAERPALRNFVRSVLEIPATILETADTLY